MKVFLILLLALTVTACQSGDLMPSSPPPNTASPAPTATPTSTQTPSLTPTTQPPAPTITPTPFQACCPLEDETFETLPMILVNPLIIPPIGRDDGHHGLDFAYYQRGERSSIQGIEVYAILSGETVLTLEDVIPYGYTILIETPLNQLPNDLQESLLEGYQPIPENVLYQGECPAFPTPENTMEMSVYHLYAHLEAPPPFHTGSLIACGQKLGTVGNTGRSSNPHLHLETRLGPSGLDLSSMAFYDPRYSEEQRASYCLWRMSGHYQLFDPSVLWMGVD
jgi:murein DD-endopeptidase MepM/ murein hydrolase activator NlpD